ncbi:acyltransferase family protein [Kaistella antarctica]|uniref:O-acetyltransferase OatA n=1 Tax=Kaistella antarctica TaxID=266748 RepID=A0A3S4YJZ4_9FLAO|nr:acyltransferase family protein [Kaistella antarctica]SEW15512.1 Peptidoglycan/LPS O-acetylase OafA/YrhL, contains acyltransferase and SGNH-hydrolase domains [Kaistella antarctica]VEH99525.1 O-acetyltransferase OatA [Kaistella antarctica]
MKFRYDISFLRAFSVIAVMFFHFKIPFFTGGFLGVDVFFVISGFLMTQIVLRKFETDSFSVLEFYKKRVLRIIPALQFLLWFVLLASMVVLLQPDIALNAKYSALASVFVSNIYFWKYVNYFTSGDNILLHTWTLGVEWQFYLLYPLLLLLLKNYFKTRRQLFSSIIVSVTLFSLCLMLYLYKSDNNFTFYMLPTRFWELSVGGCAYLASSKINLTKTVKNNLVAGSIVILIGAVYLISEKVLWPSWYTLIPVLATVAILTLNADLKIFQNKFINFLGNISYSLYLWHWVWYVLLNNFGYASGKYVVILILLSVFSAFISYRFVENNKRIATLKYISISMVAILATCAVLYKYPSNFLTQKISLYNNKNYEIGNFKGEYIKNSKDAQFNPCNCFITNNQELKEYDFSNCLEINANKPNVLLLGDSHAAQFSASLRHLKQYNIMEASAGYAFPLIETRGKKDSQLLMNYIYGKFLPLNSKKIDLVIISAHWLMKDNANLNYTLDEIKQQLLQTTAFLNRNKIKYLIIGQTEYYTLDYPRIVMLKNLGRNENEFVNEKGLEMNIFLKKIVPAENYIDIYRSSNLIHFDQNKEMPYMFDSNHFSSYGADQVLDKIVLERIIEKIRK